MKATYYAHVGNEWVPVLQRETWKDPFMDRETNVALARSVRRRGLFPGDVRQVTWED